MKKIIGPILATALLCAGLASAIPARAANYEVRLKTGMDPATITVTSSANPAAYLSEYLGKNSLKNASIAEATTYTVKITVCGKTHTSPWNKTGRGVEINVAGCDGYGFTQIR